MTELSKQNYINIGKGGTFISSGAVGSTPEDVDAIIQHLSDNNQDHIVIHFHGGLISESAGMKIAKDMIPVYEGANAHPVTMVWETGLIETLKDNLKEIHKTKLFGLVLKYVIKAAAKKLDIPIGSKGPGEELSDEKIEKELEKEKNQFSEIDDAIQRSKKSVEAIILDGLEKEIEGELRAGLGDATELEILVNSDGAETNYIKVGSLGEPGKAGQKGFFTTVQAAKTIAKVAYRVIKRHIKDRDHGFYCTVIEETLREVYLADFGEWAWTQMKEKGQEMFVSNDGLTRNNQHAGRYFIEGLASAQKQNANLTIDLVGHSLGSIAICHLLAALDDMGSAKIRNIAFLAPAASTHLVVDELVDNQDRFKQFRMYTMKDQYEIDDELVKVLYPRSLLYFISGVLETPDNRDALGDETLTGMDRHLTKKAPYDKDEKLNRLVDFLSSDNRLIKSVTDSTAPTGMRSESTSHGYFDNDVETRKSLATYLSI